MAASRQPSATVQYNSNGFAGKDHLTWCALTLCPEGRKDLGWIKNIAFRPQGRLCSEKHGNILKVTVETNWSKHHSTNEKSQMLSRNLRARSRQRLTYKVMRFNKSLADAPANLLIVSTGHADDLYPAQAFTSIISNLHNFRRQAHCLPIWRLFRSTVLLGSSTIDIQMLIWRETFQINYAREHEMEQFGR